MRITRASQRGFTLIELMFVVAIVAIVTGIVIPVVIGRLDRASPPQAASAPAMAVAAPTATAIGPDGQAARAVEIESADVRVELTAVPVLDGLRASTRYWATVRNTLVLRSDTGGPIKLAVPFPAGMTEARDVALRVLPASGAPFEPAGVAYGAHGVAWLTPPLVEGKLTVAVEFTSRGSHAFAYEIASGGRTGALRVEVLHPGVETVVQSDSLEPTEREHGRTAWRLDRVVGQRGIALDLPPGRSPLGRILLMCQLAGGAVLLFGIGFWYLSEGVRPGRLDTFRWGHFLLLALNHVAFFAVFAVIALRSEAVLAIAAATAISQTLLVLHASRIASSSFALSRVLPLSLFTLGLVTATVYAGEQRAIVIAASAMGVVAYVTVTYRRWSAGRDAHRKAVRERAAAAARGRALDEAIAELRRAHGDASEAVLDAEAALATGDAHGELAQHLRTAAETLARTLAELPPSSLRGDAPDDDALAQRLRVIRRAGERISVESDAVATSVRALAQIHRDAELRARLERERGRLAHCISCGEPGDATAAHCPRCGVARPLQRTCQRCGRGVELPQHFMRRSALRTRLHCAGCGDAQPPLAA